VKMCYTLVCEVCGRSAGVKCCITPWFLKCVVKAALATSGLT